MIHDLINYYKLFGNANYIGESVSQTEHMIQAAMLAEQNNEPIPVILACFYHDIGHLVQEKARMTGNLGVKHHEKIGGILLRRHNIPEPIPTLVENHVKTKRYKVYRDPNYKLSSASQKTLILQGGPMSEEEAGCFEQDPLFNWSIKVREYDDLAKEEDVKLKSLSYYAKMTDDWIHNKIYWNMCYVITGFHMCLLFLGWYFM